MKVKMTMIRLIIFLLLSPLLYAEMVPSKFNIKSPKVFNIANFDDIEEDYPSKWWSFGNLYIKIFPNQYNETTSYLGKKSLRIVSQTDYGTGIGKYLGIDAGRYRFLKMIIYSEKQKNGVLRIELFDDDNNNTKIESHEEFRFNLLADDKFVYTLPLDWVGWKVKIIPLSYFSDDNPTIGDNKWNPYHTDTSGGLVQMQLIFINTNDSVDIMIDDMKFY